MAATDDRAPMRKDDDVVELCKRLQQLRDEVRFALLVHRVISDASAFSIDLGLGLRERAERAHLELEKLLEKEQVRLAPEDGESRRSDARLAIADVQRRLVVLELFLYRDDPLVFENHLEGRFESAEMAYKDVFQAEGKSVADQFSLHVLRLERSLLSRIGGWEHVRFDSSAKDYEDAGVPHLSLLAMSEESAHRLKALDPTATEPTTSLRTPSGQDEFPRETAELQTIMQKFPRETAELRITSALEMAAGQSLDSKKPSPLTLITSALEMAAGQGSLEGVDHLNRAVQLARDALANIDSGTYTEFDDVERTFDRALSHLVLGCLQARTEDRTSALENLDRAVADVETVGGGWAPGAGKQDPLWKPLNELCLTALVHTATIGQPAESGTSEELCKTAGWNALRMMEAIRRRQLAGMFRGVRYLPLPSNSSVGSRWEGPGALIDELVSSEDQSVGHLPGSVVENTGHEDRGALLREHLSGFFAEAFLPSVVDLEQLQEISVGRNVVAFLDVDTTRTSVVTVPRGEAPRVELVELSETREWLKEHYNPTFNPVETGDAEALLKVPNPTDITCIIERVLGQPTDQSGATERSAEVSQLVVVPDGPLWSVPWPGLLRTGDDSPSSRFLVNSVDIFVVPALSMTAESSAEESSDPGNNRELVGAALVNYPTSLSLDKERQALEGWGCKEPHETIRDLLQAIVDSSGTKTRDGVAIIASHGKPTDHGAQDLGLGSVLTDGGEGNDTAISCVELMGVPWPGTVLLACCHSAKVDYRAASGAAPFGLPMSVLAGGADTVIGGTHVINDESTDELLGGWESDPTGATGGLIQSVRLGGEHPVAQLASVQRAWIARSGDTFSRLAPHHWARLVGLTRVLPPAPPAG